MNWESIKPEDFELPGYEVEVETENKELRGVILRGKGKALRIGRDPYASLRLYVPERKTVYVVDVETEIGSPPIKLKSSHEFDSSDDAITFEVRAESSGAKVSRREEKRYEIFSD